MSEPPRSPRRRHILSSFNVAAADDAEHDPDRKKRPRRSPRSPPREPPPPADSEHGDPRGDDQQGRPEENPDDPMRPRRSRLRLKDPGSSRHGRHRRRRRSGSRHRGSHDDLDDARRSRRDDSDRHRHRHHHGRRRRHRSPTPPNPFEEPPLDPDAAFRESLFDAMADDEGADYWAAVYGQPVHVYAGEREGGGPGGELERMTDDEYAAYVRQRMWEKTHAGIVEERARREEARRRREDEGRRRRRAHRDVEESLRRGQERRARRRRAQRRQEYDDAWAAWDGAPGGLAWPVGSGRPEDVTPEAVRAFFEAGGGDEDGEDDEKTLAARLREERVRWHPDKIMQRAGGSVDAATMGYVTAVFQIIDGLWGEVRQAKGG